MYTIKIGTWSTGIVASKLTNKFMRPSIVISEDNECVLLHVDQSGVLILQVILDSVNDGTNIWGGHKMAGGLNRELKNKDFKNF